MHYITGEDSPPGSFCRSRCWFLSLTYLCGLYLFVVPFWDFVSPGTTQKIGWFAFHSAPEGLARQHQMPCRTSSCRWISEQRHSPRRIAKHLSKAGLCRWRRNFVTRFLQKNFAATSVIASDENFIEEDKNANTGILWTNEHRDKRVNIYVIYR